MSPLMQVRISIVVGTCALLNACVGGSTKEEPPTERSEGTNSVYISDATPVGVGRRNTDVGLVFTDAAGMTLYLRKSAAPCLDTNPAKEDLDPLLQIYAEYKAPTCVAQWPPLLAAENARPVVGWSLIARPDGTKQWAYQGHGVYRSYKDRLPGDVSGLPDEVFRFGDAPWEVAKVPLNFPPGIGTLYRNGVGLIAVTTTGRTLYTQVEAASKSTEKTLFHRVSLGCADCSANVGKDWQSIFAPASAVATGPWKPIKQADGMNLWGFKGRAVYSFVRDFDANDINGMAEGAEPVVLVPSPQAPPGITVQRSYVGSVYADSRGLTLYVFACHLIRPGSGFEIIAQDGYTCDNWDDDVAHREQFCPAADRCGEMWQPIQAPASAQAHGGTWSVATIPDPRYPLRWVPVGTPADQSPGSIKVWTFKGQPVYHALVDQEPQEVWGVVNNFGTRWKPVRAGTSQER